MPKIKTVPTDSMGNIQYQFWCVGCGYEHAFETKEHAFNGDLNNPIVSPSILHRSPLCHSMIYNGRIRYFRDCQHDFGGKDLELPDIDIMVQNRLGSQFN
jgi:hypothetical protein